MALVVVANVLLIVVAQHFLVALSQLLLPASKWRQPTVQKQHPQQPFHPPPPLPPPQICSPTQPNVLVHPRCHWWAAATLINRSSFSANMPFKGPYCRSHTTRRTGDEELQGMYGELEIASSASFLEPYLACRPDAEIERCRRDHFVSLDLDHQHHRLRTVLHLTPLKNVVPVSGNHSTNHRRRGERAPRVVRHRRRRRGPAPNGCGSTEWDYDLSVLVLFGGMSAFGFSWWVITSSVIPAAWGPFVITAALPGLVESDTTWVDLRVVSIIEVAYSAARWTTNTSRPPSPSSSPRG
jgi:hypothetical protein